MRFKMEIANRLAIIQDGQPNGNVVVRGSMTHDS